MSYTTSVVHNGDGTTTDFAVPFPYVSAADLSITRKNGPVSFTFVNAGLIRLGAPLAVGDAIYIKRVTDLTKLKTKILGSTGLTSVQLDANFQQILYAAQEAANSVGAALIDEGDSTFNTRGYRIRNVGTPIEATDAVTKGYVDNAVNSLGSALDEQIDEIEGDIDELGSAVNLLNVGKANVSHNHSIGDVTNLQSTLNNKANKVHNHTVADVAGLESALESKATNSALNALSNTVNQKADASVVSALQSLVDTKANASALAGKSNTGHGHTVADVLGLADTLTGIDGDITALEGTVGSLTSQMAGKQPAGTYLTGLEAGTGVTIDNTNPNRPRITLQGGDGEAIAVAWGDITGKPSVFAPDDHDHVIEDVTGLQTALNAKMDKTGGTFSGTVTAPIYAFSGGGWIHSTTSAISLALDSTFFYNMDKNNQYHRFYVGGADKFSIRETQLVAGVPVFCSATPTSGNHYVNKTYVDNAVGGKASLTGANFTGDVTTTGGLTAASAWITGGGNFVTPGTDTTGGVRVRANTTNAHAVIQFTDNAVTNQWGALVVNSGNWMQWTGGFEVTGVNGITASGKVWGKTGILGSGGNYIMAKNTVSANEPTAIQRFDGSNWYLMFSNPSTTWNSTWNALRPITVNATTGVVTMENGLNVAGGSVIFANTPTVPVAYPTANNQVANKAYVDAAAWNTMVISGKDYYVPLVGAGLTLNIGAKPTFTALSGTSIQPTHTSNNWFTYTNSGAFTLVAPPDDGTYLIVVANTSGAGAVTGNGFNKINGTLPVTSTGRSYIHITKGGGVCSATIEVVVA